MKPIKNCVSDPLDAIKYSNIPTSSRKNLKAFENVVHGF